MNPVQDRFSGTNWRPLGELELPVNSEVNDAITVWLMEILSPLDLHTDLLNKVLKSAQRAAGRIMQFETVMKIKHIHFLVFAARESGANGQTWGFFRIEKIESATSENSDPNHAIQFYLYPEG